MDHVLYLLTLLDETHGKVSLPFHLFFKNNLCTPLFCPPLGLPLSRSVPFSLPLSLSKMLHEVATVVLENCPIRQQLWSVLLKKVPPQALMS